jgi:hypothetical protein
MKKNSKTSARSAKSKSKVAPRSRKISARKKAGAPATRKAPPRRNKKNSPATDIDSLGELPQSYGAQERIFVIAQEPRLLFCYWDHTLTEGLVSQVFLRHSLPGRATHEGEAPVPLQANSWYLPVREEETTYRVELGFYAGNEWKTLTQSDAVLTPRESLAEPGEAVFADINFHLVFQEMVEKLRTEMRDGDTLSAAISRLRKHSETSSEKLSPAQISVLEAMLVCQLQSLSSGELARMINWSGASFNGARSAAAVSSWEAGGASWGAAPGEVASGFLAQFGLGGGSVGSGSWSPASGSWSSGVVSSWAAASTWGPGASWSAQPFSHQPERGFFMHVNAEVIFYGGTHPDAKVTVDGKEINLRPDGSFHFHFVFPDDAYEIPIVAASPDGKETRRAVLRLERATSREGEIGHTPPSPLSRPMGSRS